jgi:hypothetical protein
MATIPVCTLKVAICARMSRSGKRLDNLKREIKEIIFVTLLQNHD